MIWLRISWAAAMLTALERRCRKYVTKDVAVHDWPTSSAGSLRLCIYLGELAQEGERLWVHRPRDLR